MKFLVLAVVLATAAAAYAAPPAAPQDPLALPKVRAPEAPTVQTVAPQPVTAAPSLDPQEKIPGENPAIVVPPVPQTVYKAAVEPEQPASNQRFRPRIFSRFGFRLRR